MPFHWVLCAEFRLEGAKRKETGHPKKTSHQNHTKQGNLHILYASGQVKNGQFLEVCNLRRQTFNAKE